MRLRNLFLLTLVMLTALTSGAAQPKYIFYFIGDGMGNGPVMATQTYIRLAQESDRKLNMLSLPVSSQSTTYSASSPVTDSAAAGTALATGHKTNNGMLGVTPDTIPVTSVATHLHNAGYGVGLITTVAPDDATPGAFYAHVPSRKMYYQIGKQAAESGFEFIAGSSLRGAIDKKTRKPTDLIDYITSQGVEIAYGIDQLAEKSADRIILLEKHPFNSSNIGYTIDSIPGTMTLSQMTRAAIDHLSRTNPDRFFLMVEGGNIDHSLHSNDAATAIMETIAFDNALSLALDFYNAHPDETLIVVTADHDTGGISIGNNHTGYMAYPKMLTHSRISKDRLSNICEKMMKENTLASWDDARALLSDRLGLFSAIPLEDEEEAQLQEIFNRVFIEKKPNDQHTLYSRINEFAAVAVDILNKKAGFGWTTLAHTGNTVPVFAIGAGSELFAKWNDNTMLPALILESVGMEL